MLTVVSQDSAGIQVSVRWTPMLTAEGAAFARHEWEARDAATLIANGIATEPHASFFIPRPPLGNSLRGGRRDYSD